MKAASVSPLETPLTKHLKSSLNHHKWFFKQFDRKKNVITASNLSCNKCMQYKNNTVNGVSELYNTDAVI